MDESGRRRPTKTQEEQWQCEGSIFQIFELFDTLPMNDQSMMLELCRHSHLDYLTSSLRYLGPSFSILDSSRPWLCYWILHSIAILGETVDPELEDDTIDFLNRCQDEDGGYGGGPGQLPHLATTYAAVNSLITLGGQNSLSSIKRDELYSFLLRMKHKSGAFRVHDAGEMDVRACYTAISVASILNILDHELVRNVGTYITCCQTYEGGIAGEPGSEAHGGYTFCGLATMILIGEINRLDLPRLVKWLVFRQSVECGFQGRTNKLVDGCYSFWQGAALTLLQRSDSYLHSGSRSQFKDDSVPLFQPHALQRYILLCSQVKEGGFVDKPGKRRDFYHTCYCLSGLSLSQRTDPHGMDSPSSPKPVLGPESNRTLPVHPIFNVLMARYEAASAFFRLPEGSSYTLSQY